MKSRIHKVIVVEDEAIIRRNIVKKIHDLFSNFKVIGDVMNGEEALDLIEEDLPDVVITDIEMPLMNGLELVKNLYFAYPNIKVVILSGHNDFEFARKAMQYGVKEYLLKPVNSEQLQSTLSRIEIEINKDMEELGSIATTLSDKASPETIANTVKKVIKENYNKDISLQEIANELNFTVDYLGKIFRKYEKETPIKYITKLRINEAKRLLLIDVDMDIQTVGKLVGYPDPHYFSRVFKKKTGYYPSEYRGSKSS